MNTKRRSLSLRGSPAGTAVLVALLSVLAVSAAASAAAAPAAVPPVSIVSDASGGKLQVDGKDFMIYGMNWGWMPIGENYNYVLWNQPDDIIKEALARDMPLLQEMGVNAIRQGSDIPPSWVRYIYENYGILTVVNHTVGRYGYTIDGVWTPTIDYSNPRVREVMKEDIAALVKSFQGTPGVLMWLLGNENNYGLHWTSFEIEALPQNEREAARARYLYSLFSELTDEIKGIDPNHPVAIANGDVQYIDIIAEECKNLDILGTNVYRGISARDLFQVVREKLGIPVMFSEFGADAYNAKEMREDQAMQAKYLIGQWEEIYEQSYGKGREGNAIGGFIFQWSDGWWKYGQEDRLDIHDTHASWPNGGYIEDYVPGENNMNEEWWGITAKGPPDFRKLYNVYPRAAYYALRRAFKLPPYAPTTDLAAIRAYFGEIRPAGAVLEARGDKAELLAGPRDKVHVSGVRLELETYNTGGTHITTPEAPAVQASRPNFLGFDHMEAFYIGVEARPADTVTGSVTLNIRGNIPENPIDEIFYDNRGYFLSEEGTSELVPVNRVRVYDSSISWEDRWFLLNGFYRTGHLHWGFEGDFFGLYRDAFYGENIDIYGGIAPVGFEIAGKRSLDGLKLAFGPELWWGANPAIFVKYRRNVGPFDATAIYQDDIAKQSAVNSSIAIPLPKNRKASLQLAAQHGPWGLEVGGLWSGSTKMDDKFQIAEETDESYRILQDEVAPEDAFGAKGKVTWEHGRYHWYAQAAHMGLVADAGPTEVITFTDWFLKDSGLGNQNNVMSGVAVDVGHFQIGPNFLYQKPIIGPIPSDVPAPGRPRNILVDPFAVRDNRETVGGELLVTYDPTPATWFWAWDNDTREDAHLAAAVGYVYRHLPTTQDVTNYVAEDGHTVYAFTAAPPPADLWEVRARLVSRLSPDSRVVATAYVGRAQPSGWDPTGANTQLDRTITHYGMAARLTSGPIALDTFVKVDDWGPYDYHRDFNLTYPLQLMGDLSYSLGTPRWFGYAQTRLGVRMTWRSLDENSPRYDGVEGDPNGSEWEFRTYLHVAL